MNMSIMEEFQFYYGQGIPIESITQLYRPHKVFRIHSLGYADMLKLSILLP